MEKSRIFVASSERTQTLAEKLSEALGTEYCEAQLWKDEREGKSSETVIEMLEDAVGKYDFAIVILSQDDVVTRDRGNCDVLKARDNCIFEAGLFMAALGRRRCFLVNSVSPRELPSDLCGIISLPFTEPPNLTNRDECGKAIKGAVANIKNSVQAMGRRRNRPLSVEELLDREKLYSDGELKEDHVVVVSVQPLELSYAAALQVRQNINAGVRYVYFFHGNMDGAQKICRLLQMMLLAPSINNKTEAAKAGDFTFRESLLRGEDVQKRVLDDLEQICKQESLKIFFLPSAPTLQYCIHNATSVDYAVLYLKQREKYIEWEKGTRAQQFWDEVRQKQGMDLETNSPFAIFRGASGFDVKQDHFIRTLRKEVDRYFLPVSEKVTKICLDGI